MKKTVTALLTWITADSVKGVRKIDSKRNADVIVYPAKKTARSAQVVVQNEKLYFAVLGQENHEIWGYTLHCYLENRSDQPLLFVWDDAGLNECRTDPYFSKEIAPGMSSDCDICFSSSDFEETEYAIRVYDAT